MHEILLLLELQLSGFLTGKDGIFLLPHLLKISLLMFVISLSFDLLQYIYQTATWGIFHRYYEKKIHSEDSELLASSILIASYNSLLV